MTLSDIWHVYILGKHKHRYKRIEDGHVEIEICEKCEKVNTVTYVKIAKAIQRHWCTICKEIVGLDDWQIKDLPADMKYS